MATSKEGSVMPRVAADSSIGQIPTRSAGTHDLATARTIGGPDGVITCSATCGICPLTKAEAQAAGRAAAKKDGVERLIHKKDATIGDRNSYGNDPHPPKG